MRGIEFTMLLLEWNGNDNKRLMPWKGEKDPYKVWFSEVILQKTRVEQGWNYYEKFVKKFPRISLLAKAKDEVVFKMWEGLGYYSRCKNLLHSARFITKEYKGKFPSTYDEIEQLKGVGPYTAAAIASFCFKLPHAVIDGNVFRILSRVFGIETPIDSNAGKKQFKELADELLDKNDPGTYNQAIMDFGATVCKPALPLCATCKLNSICVAYKTGTVSNLPVKEKSLEKKLRWFSYFIFHYKNKTFVRKRTAKDIWQNLFEYFLVETEANPQWNEEAIKEVLTQQLSIKEFETIAVVLAEPQQLTHQTIKGYFVDIKLGSIPKQLNTENDLWLAKDEIRNIPFPGFINQHLQNKNIQASLF